jgi:hypothetical protein
VSGDGPKKLIYLGSFPEGLPNRVILPAPAIRKIEADLDAEHRQREALAAKAKLAVMQQARGRAKLKKALTACFGFRRGRRGR